MPKVSVIIPAYNAEPFIRSTVESVLAQDYRDFEIIVVDDGSTDATAALAESFGPPVRCLSKVNGGVSKARNLGIERAAGEYVAFLDADDLWEPTKLGQQVELLDRQAGVGLCFTGVRKVDQRLRSLAMTPARDYTDFTVSLLLYSCVVTGSCSSVVVRRDLVLQAGGFDPRLSTCADWDLWLRLSRLTPFAPIDEPLVQIRTVAGSMSSNPALVERDTFATLEKFYAEAQPEYCRIQSQVYANHWMILSGCYLHTSRWRDSVRCLAQSLALKPGKVTRPLGLPFRWLRRRVSSGRVFS